MIVEEQTAQDILRKERSQVTSLESREPWRRSLLAALGQRLSGSKELAEEAGLKESEALAKLALLIEQGLVCLDQEGGYALTLYGRSELGRHLAFGAREPLPPPPTPEQIAAFMREALAGAISMRERGQLADARDRFEEIYSQAKEAGEDDISLAALAELNSM